MLIALKKDTKALQQEVEHLKAQLLVHGRLGQGLDPVPFVPVSEESAGYPSVFINTLPKSGSVFLARSLQQTTGMEFQKLGYGSYPEDLIDYNKATYFGHGGRISQEHVNASNRNIKLLELFAKRWVLHLRDPRSSMWSWIHHLDRLHNENADGAVRFGDPFLPDDYFQWDMDRKIDWQIENYLPQSVTWIQGWWEYYARHPERMLVTSYKELHKNSQELIEKILAYYGIRPAGVKMQDKTMASHFRTGMIGEWKTIFKSYQLQKAEKICHPLHSTFTGLDYLVD